jgi:hypothetical protein
MRPKFQKQSALKLAGRIIPRAKLSWAITKACFGVHTRDFKNSADNSLHIFLYRSMVVIKKLMQ